MNREKNSIYSTLDVVKRTLMLISSNKVSLEIGSRERFNCKMDGNGH